MQCGHGFGHRGRKRRTPESGDHQLVRILAVDPIPHRQAQFRDSGLLQRCQLEPRHDDRRRPARRHHQRSQALERLRPRTDEILQVVSRSDDESRQAGRGRRVGRLVQAAGVHVRTESHASTLTSGRGWQDDDMPGPLLLLDGASMWFRSYFGVPSSITSPDGRPVNALRGFLDAVATVITRERPDRLVVCLDLDWRPQWRVNRVPSYKAHRLAEEDPGGEPDVEEVPDELTPQVDWIL